MTRQEQKQLSQLRRLDAGDRRGLYDRLIRAVEQTEDIVLITDKRGIVEYVNPAFEKTTGYSANEILGRTPRVLKSGAHDKKFYKDLWKLLTAGRPFHGVILNRKKSGQIFSSAQTISSMKNENGEITHFVSVLKDVTELRKQQQQEFYLQVAHEVQERFNTPAVSLPGFDIAGGVRSAMLTGGDYFDYIVQRDGRLCIAIGDVSGHGFGAALLMAELRAYVRSYTMLESDLGTILLRVNNSLAPDLNSREYVTLLLVRLDPINHLLEYAGAGHIPGYLLRPSGEIGHIMKSTGRPLGLFAASQFEASPAIPLRHGDTLALLTDGVTESASKDETSFGADRAIEFIKHHPHKSAAELVRGIHETAKDFTGGSPQLDDMTSVICRVKSAARTLRCCVAGTERECSGAA